MIFLIGGGSLLTSVGTAMIWSPLANCGFLRRSMISMRYRPCRLSSQTRRRLAIAASEFGVCPAMYNLILLTSCFACFFRLWFAPTGLLGAFIALLLPGGCGAPGAPCS